MVISSSLTYRKGDCLTSSTFLSTIKRKLGVLSNDFTWLQKVSFLCACLRLEIVESFTSSVFSVNIRHVTRESGASSQHEQVQIFR